MDSGAQTLAQAEYAIATSTESEANVVPIVELYTVFNRAPDAAGLQYWVGALRGGESLMLIAGSFLTSAEGQKIYGTTVGTNPAANIAFLDTAYQNVLGRAPDAAGEQYLGWSAQRRNIDASSGAREYGRVLRGAGARCNARHEFSTRRR